jgi:hypothetical protein
VCKRQNWKARTSVDFTWKVVWRTVTVVDSLQTSVAMAAVPVDVEHQNGRLDYCCYGECFQVHTGQAGWASEQGYDSPQPAPVVHRYSTRATRYLQPRIGTRRASFGLTTQELPKYF